MLVCSYVSHTPLTENRHNARLVSVTKCFSMAIRKGYWDMIKHILYKANCYVGLHVVCKSSCLQEAETSTDIKSATIASQAV